MARSFGTASVGPGPFFSEGHQPAHGGFIREVHVTTSSREHMGLLLANPGPSSRQATTIPSRLVAAALSKARGQHMIAVCAGVFLSGGVD